MIDKAGRTWLYCMICRKRVPKGRWACTNCGTKDNECLSKKLFRYVFHYTGKDPSYVLHGLKERDEQLPEWLSDFIASISLREAVAIVRRREKHKRQRP
jgi:hypothetical protein